LEIKKWGLEKRWKKCEMWDFREKGQGIWDQDPPPQGGYSGFQVTGMIEWSQKYKTQKNP